MRRLRFRRPTPAMVVAIIALFVALGGTGYAAFKLPPHSVGKEELKRNAVTTAKIDNGTIRLKDFYRRDLRRLRRAAAGRGGVDDFEDFEDFDDFEEPEEPAEPGGSEAEAGAALLTGSAGGLPASGQPAERSALSGSDNAEPEPDGVASLTPSREFDISDLSVAVNENVPNNASVAVEIVTRAVAATAETVVLGCTVAGTAAGPARTCTAAGPGTLPANQLVYTRITITGGASPDRVYWGVSVEP
jgi:hypothetical protein